MTGMQRMQAGKQRLRKGGRRNRNDPDKFQMVLIDQALPVPSSQTHTAQRAIIGSCLWNKVKFGHCSKAHLRIRERHPAPDQVPAKVPPQPVTKEGGKATNQKRMSAKPNMFHYQTVRIRRECLPDRLRTPQQPCGLQRCKGTPVPESPQMQPGWICEGRPGLK